MKLKLTVTEEKRIGISCLTLSATGLLASVSMTATGRTDLVTVGTYICSLGIGYVGTWLLQHASIKANEIKKRRALRIEANRRKAIGIRPKKSTFNTWATNTSMAQAWRGDRL